MKSVVRNTLIVLTAIGMATVSACGRKGALVPPEALVPAAVDTIAVQQQGWDFLITWSAPDKEQGGRPLRDLAGFKLLRRRVLPAEADCSACGNAWQPIADIDLDLPKNVQQSNGAFIFRDALVAPATACQYRLLAKSRSGGVSRPATSPVKKILPVPSPPDLKASITPTGISLELAPRGLAFADVAGFNIYRRHAGTAPDPLPLNRAPITGPVWEDRQVDFGSTYRYGATTLVKINGDLVESAPGTEVELVFTQPEIR